MSLRHANNPGAKQFTVPAEPIAPLSELRRYLLRVTPILEEGYLSYCYGIVGATILILGEAEKVEVLAFEVLLGELPLPIHTIQRPGKEPQRVLLAMHEHRPLELDAPRKPLQHDLKVALARLLVASGCATYGGLVKAMSSEMMEPPKLAAEVQGLHTRAQEVMGQCGDEAQEVLEAEMARLAGAEGERPQNTVPDNTVHPHMRAHTVSLVASEEIPFDLFWPMVRDDILGAVREACPRAHHASESAIQAGVQQDGLGPLATRLTLEEAEMLAARVGHVVRTAVSVDQQAVQDIKKEKDKKEGEHVAAGVRVQFQGRGDSWMPGVVVGHGLTQPQAQKARPCDIIDDHGVLWERVPAAQVHAQSHQDRSLSQRREAPELPGGRLTAPRRPEQRKLSVGHMG